MKPKRHEWITEKNLNVNKNLINSGNVQAVGKISIIKNTNNTGEILTNSILDTA